jgi:two-component system, NarL family, response regulator LiaR
VKKILLYGAVLGLLIFILKYIEYKVTVKDHATDLYMGAIALLFTSVGIWAGLKFTRKKEVVVEKQVVKEVAVFIDRGNFVLNENLLRQLSISKREYEVLELIAAGLSNRQIADKLFVSENTIKTHSSRLFEKLDVNRRTQAVEKAKSLGLIR